MEYTYIHDTHTIFEANGELHLVSDDKTVIFNCENLFNDLPFIIEMVLKARTENTKLIKNEIIKTINKNK
jgi:hypothetical protein